MVLFSLTTYFFSTPTFLRLTVFLSTTLFSLKCISFTSSSIFEPSGLKSPTSPLNGSRWYSSSFYPRIYSLRLVIAGGTIILPENFSAISPLMLKVISRSTFPPRGLKKKTSLDLGGIMKLRSIPVLPLGPIYKKPSTSLKVI